MSRQENVVRFYVLTNKLKNVIRTGWKKWKVKKERLESVAEHIFGTQMLAIAINSEYDYDINLTKVIYMLAIHELEEIYIGDLTMFQVSKEEKRRLGKQAVKDVLSGLINKDELESLINEFEEKQTKEAKFAYFCDKLECDLQSKLYDEENCVDLNNQQDNEVFFDSRVQKLLNEGMSFSEMWMRFGQSNYNYDEPFLEVSNYAINNKVKTIDKRR